MESSVISFCQNWSIVSAIYIFQAININQRLNPDTTTGYNLKQWLEEAAQCRLPSIDLSKFNSPVSQSSLQDRLDELYSLLKNNDIPNQKRSIKYLSISNKKLMDDNQINKNTIAFFARLEGSGNIQTNLMIKNVNWRLAAVFSGNPKICFCYIDNQWKNLSCKCMNNNWNGSDTILCYTKDKKLEPISINISNLQNTDCLFCMGNKNAVKNEKKNAGKAINKGNLTANKNSLKEESKIETPQKKKKNNNNCIEGQKKKGSSGNCRISIINNSTKLSVFTKPITCVDFLSKTSESNTRESDISVPQDPAFHDFSCQYSQGDLFPSQGPIFQDFSCQYSEENLCQNQKQSNFDKCFDHQKQIDSLKSKIKQQEKKIEDLELTSKNEARKGEKKEILLNLENSKREINDLKETIDDKERKIKKLEQELECEKSKNKDFSIKEIDSLKKLNEEMNKSDEKSNNPPQSTLWCFKELRRNFLIIENSKESIMIASTMKNPIKMTESCKEINNYDQIKNKNAIFEEEKAVKENLNIYSVPIFQYRKWGLPNIGNSCYMNSLLQILASTNCFVKAVQNISNCPMLEKISILAEQIRNKSTKMQALISSLENFRLEIGKQFPHVSST
ncbi:unnamed protein product [Blepharisma stoltei]|uniref:USP domain-containing protein n=1 Tax=Blepharisma stoltei TaxID=1481888 RepID=A0AAU9ICF9_9CILI|nr:unnamed protein product [Blepharisma stoltei]